MTSAPAKSKSALLEVVKSWRWRELGASLEHHPQLRDVRDDRGRNWLHHCCAVDARKVGRNARDSLRTARVLIDAGLEVDSVAFRDADGFIATPLWYAIAFGRNLALAKYLLSLGARPHHCLWAAAYNDDAGALRLLAKHGAPVDAVGEGATPFFAAVQWSRFGAARALLELGADPNWRDAKQRTALHVLLAKGTAAQEIEKLIAHGARLDIPNGKGATAAAILRRKRNPAYRRLAER